MAKVTSKLQVTVPKAIADLYGIRPGDEIVWTPAGDSIRVTPSALKQAPDLETRLRWFDQATERQRRRTARQRRISVRERGWTREELYTRGSPR